MQLGVWNTIFLLLTIIPVARLFSTIFMKLVVRAGTINEEKWAGRATAGFGTITGLMTLSRAVGGAFGPRGGVRPSITGTTAGTTQATASRSHMAPAEVLGVLAGGRMPEAGMGAGGARSGPYGGSAGAASDTIPPPGWQATPGGLVVPGGSIPGRAEEQGAGDSQADRADPPGRTVFEEMVDDHDHARARATGTRVGSGVGLVAGALTGESLAVVGAGAIMGVAGQMAGSTIHTVGRLTKGVAGEMRGGRGLGGALRRVTGDATSHEAAARTVTAVLTAPLGRGVQRHTSTAAAWTAGRVGRIGGHVAQAAARIRER